MGARPALANRLHQSVPLAIADINSHSIILIIVNVIIIIITIAISISLWILENLHSEECLKNLVLKFF